MTNTEIIWTGLKDDLTAEIGGYTLRVEKMTDNQWWWQVYTPEGHDLNYDCAKVQSKNKAIEKCLETVIIQELKNKDK